MQLPNFGKSETEKIGQKIDSFRRTLRYGSFLAGAFFVGQAEKNDLKDFRTFQ